MPGSADGAEGHTGGGTISESLRRIDGRLKVTGQMQFTLDLANADTLFAAAVRSPHAHARIVSVDVQAAARLPGVHAVLCGADVAAIRTGRGMQDVPILAVEKVRWMGEMVAAVAADTPEIAQRAAGLVQVEYAPLPAVFDPQEALAPGAPQLHNEPWRYPGVARSENDLPNVISRFEHTVGGDVEAALDAAEHVFTHTFRTPRVHQGYLEPFSCTARFNSDATIDVQVANKSPFTLRRQLAATFDLPPEHVVVRAAAIGGDFGAKGGPLEVPVCVELSRRTGRAVRWLRSYTDELTAGTPAPGSVSTVRVGVNHDGCIQAFAMCTWLDAGAYGGYAASSLERMMGGTAYRIPVARVEVVRVYTNQVPNGSMRAPGAMQVVFATEAMMDLVARELGIDPFEFRRSNLLRTGEVGLTGTLWPEHRGREVLDAAERASAEAHIPRLPSNVLFGRGVAVSDRPTHAPMHTSMRLRLRPDGCVEAQTPIPETGTGAHSVAQRVLARELQIAPERIRVDYVGTGDLPFDFGVGGQMVTGTLANVCVHAAEALTGELRTRGIDLRTSRAPYPGVEVMVETPDQSLHEGGVNTYCAQAAKVAVDVETGEVTVLDFVSAHDVAEVIDPVSHRGQIEGGFAMGLGFALSEDLALVDGRVTASHLGEYKLACQRDMPPFRGVLVEGGQGNPAWNTKAIGEMSNLGVAPAIANAVSDAIGVQLDTLPLTSESVFSRLHAHDRPTPDS